MDFIFFYIVMGISLSGVVAMLFLEYPIRLRVKAGNAKDYVFRFSSMSRITNIKVDDQIIDVTDLIPMIAAGNSMQDYDIQYGDKVFITKLIDGQKKAINSYPVVAIRMTKPHLPFDSRYKLRKFLCYTDDTNWEQIYNCHKSRIKEEVSVEMFTESCQKSYEKNPFELGEAKCGIISETYDVREKAYHYSVHPTNLLYGIVSYISA